jgi:ABC-type transporter Mla MlaB component
MRDNRIQKSEVRMTAGVDRCGIQNSVVRIQNEGRGVFHVPASGFSILNSFVASCRSQNLEVRMKAGVDRCGIKNSEFRIQNEGRGVFHVPASGFCILYSFVASCRSQNSEVRIQNEGRGLLYILASVFCLLYSFAASAEIIDRIVITVGNQVVTQSQIDDEIRVTAFLNRDKVDLNPDARKQAAGRLIEQALIKREMELSHYPLPELSDANESLQHLQAMYSSGTNFQNVLQNDGVTLDELTRRLWWQLTLLRFIDYRFRPGIQITPPDVQAYYRRQVSEWEQKGTKPIPTLEESRDQIEEILTQQRIDQALEQWIKNTRSQVAIKYLDPALQ